jgi:hypothetical protein
MHSAPPRLRGRWYETFANAVTPQIMSLTSISKGLPKQKCQRFGPHRNARSDRLHANGPIRAHVSVLLGLHSI